MGGSLDHILDSGGKGMGIAAIVKDWWWGGGRGYMVVLGWRLSVV